jgi:hypothetical protein
MRAPRAWCERYERTCHTSYVGAAISFDGVKCCVLRQGYKYRSSVNAVTWTTGYDSMRDQ